MGIGVLRKYKDFLPVTDATPLLSLGEGDTPLVRSNRLGKELGCAELYFKLEGCNPTGSFKDRGMVVAIAKAIEQGSQGVICASTGNTSASAAAYSAYCDLPAFVMIPKGEVAAGKLAQALAYGAKILMVNGNFDAALSLVRAFTSKHPLSPSVGAGMVTDYLRSTGLEALKGADIVKIAPEKYSSSVEYPNSPIAAHLKDIAQVYLADLGTRIFYTQHASFDTHAGEMAAHPKLWQEVSEGITAFFQDLHEHGRGDNVIMYLFSEFGRRVHDNGSGTDHGAAGVSFLIGDPVKGGMYNEMPSRKPEHLDQGDLVPNYDFRGAYATIVEDWFGLDPKPIVNGSFEKLNLLK